MQFITSLILVAATCGSLCFSLPCTVSPSSVASSSVATTTATATNPDSTQPASILTADIIAAAAPATLSCDTTTEIADRECRDPEEAAEALNAVFLEYGLDDPTQQAAVLAYLAFESVDFGFQTNQFPGRPGQGTRSMLLFNFVYDYALDTESTAEEALALTDNLQVEDIVLDEELNPSGIEVATQQQVLGLVIATDELSFGAAPWFLTTKCRDTVEELKSGSLEAFNSYMVDCINTTAAPERLDKYNVVLQAMGLPTV